VCKYEYRRDNFSKQKFKIHRAEDKKQKYTSSVRDNRGHTVKRSIKVKKKVWLDAHPS
jgi:hypothetical protein